MPVKDLKWFSDQPDSKLSSYGVRQERHAVKYLNMGIELSTTTRFMERVIGDRLVRRLETVQEPMTDEFRRCIDSVFGTNDKEWTELNVYDSMQNIIVPTIIRVFLGLPLSREPRVLKAFHRYILALGLGTIFVGELPRVLKAVVARAVKLPLWYYRSKMLCILMPVVGRQSAQRVEGKFDDKELSFIQACAEVSKKSTVDGIGNVCRPEVIAEWILSMV